MRKARFVITTAGLLFWPLLTNAESEPEQPRDLGEIVKAGKPPRPIKQEEPVYPYQMMQAGLIGAVKIEFIIDKTGGVENAYVVGSNNPWFERPAVDAVMRWKFQPAEMNGRPVYCRAMQLIEFQLNPGGGQAPEIWRVSKGKDFKKMPPELQWDTPPTPTSTLFPVYPFELLKSGQEGKVKISYLVGPEGRVLRAKLQEASSPEFGQAVLAMIDGWRFEPARKKNGIRCYANLGSTYDFRKNGRGDVPVTEAAQAILRDLEKAPDKITLAKNLDQPLRPRSRRPPVYPTALAEAGQPGETVIEFFVDKNGDAQLPRIISSSAPEFGYAAVQAVATWRFEPPKKNGKAVTTMVQVPVAFALEPPPSSTPP